MYYFPGGFIYLFFKQIFKILTFTSLFFYEERHSNESKITKRYNTEKSINYSDEKKQKKIKKQIELKKKCHMTFLEWKTIIQNYTEMYVMITQFILYYKTCMHKNNITKFLFQMKFEIFISYDYV